MEHRSNEFSGLKDPWYTGWGLYCQAALPKGGRLVLYPAAGIGMAADVASHPVKRSGCADLFPFTCGMPC